jgi:hypothetical protein
MLKVGGTYSYHDTTTKEEKEKLWEEFMMLRFMSNMLLQKDITPKFLFAPICNC